MKNLCKIDGCGRVTRSRGWCNAHYQRWCLHGDPLGGAPSPSPAGEPERFYREVVLTYEDDECLTWPFSRVNGRYGKMLVDGDLCLVHRRLCEEVRGPAPTPDHEAAHSCGKGHLACVTKRHLDWKTRAGNAADMFDHGTAPLGDRCPFAKLSEADVLAIRALKGRAGSKSIASRFSVSSAQVNRILSGKSWSWLLERAA